MHNTFRKVEVSDNDISMRFDVANESATVLADTFYLPYIFLGASVFPAGVDVFIPSRAAAVCVVEDCGVAEEQRQGHAGNPGRSNAGRSRFVGEIV
jgi:hypothetical protein